MKTRIKQSFDAVYADKALCEKTSAWVAHKMQERARVIRGRYVQAAAALACLVLVSVGGWTFFTPTSVVSIDVNPSVELRVNRFDRVLSCEGFNDDGKTLADTVDVRFMDYQQALTEIINSPAVVACLDQDEWLSIVVTGRDALQNARMLEQTQNCTASCANAHCYAADATPEEVEQAHALGLSYGKYRAYLDLQKLDPQLTPEQVQQMTMREIRQRIAELSGEQVAAGQSGTKAQGSGHKYGKNKK